MNEPLLTFEEWRGRARPLLAARMVPLEACPLIAEGRDLPKDIPSQSLTLPAPLMALLDSIACFRTAGRYELMYRLAWRTLCENPRLMEDEADPDVRHARMMDAAVRRDEHKMHAFVRFREVLGDDGRPSYFAWFEPAHDILRRAAAFFVRRFANMRWTIATPSGAAVWDEAVLTFTTSPAADTRPRTDSQESLWRTYYRSICNSARINPMAMQREMPRKYWKNLPEAADIDELLRSGAEGPTVLQAARSRGDGMTRGVKQALDTLPAAGEGPESCRRCDLWQNATQAVEGRGPSGAGMMLVGEQPGDEEDLRGDPFIGPAGKVLDQALLEAQVERSTVYITNAVKHFKWEPRGKRRLHKKPALPEINACNIWLLYEIDRIKPRVIVALGATALRALTGRPLTIAAARREVLHNGQGALIVATYHPSAILRAEGDGAETLRASLVADLVRARTKSTKDS